MRRTVTARWFGSFLVLAVLAGGFRPSWAEDATPPAPAPAPAPATTAEIVGDGLSKILMGGAPNTVAGLVPVAQGKGAVRTTVMLPGGYPALVPTDIVVFGPAA